MSKLRLALLVSIAWLLPGCSPIDALNWVTPDGGDSLVADLPYGAGPRQKLDIYVPDGVSAAAPAPVVVFFYGGGWDSGQRQDYRFAAQAFSAMGYVTVVPDYRLWPQVRYPDFVDDSADAVAWTAANIAQYGGDPQRLVLAGHSAGAYNAAMLAMDPHWLTARGVSSSAIRAFVGLAGPYDFLPFDGPRVVRVFGHVADPPATQPIHYVRPNAPPMLLLHGTGDDTVYLKNSVNLDAAQRAAGGRSQLVQYPDIGHVRLIVSLAEPFRGSAVPVFEDISAFLRTVIQEAPRAGQ
jgi:acetyl esterase/lipase